jgi:hypothetical protein
MGKKKPTAKHSSSKARTGVTATYAVEVNGNLLYQKGKLEIPHEVKFR